MTTSDLGAAGAPPAELTLVQDPLAALTPEIARLANALFQGGAPAPGSANPFEQPGPSALAVGAGGASPALALPPMPGAAHAPPLPVSPAPTETDLRKAPGALAAGFGGGSPLAFASEPQASGAPPSPPAGFGADVPLAFPTGPEPTSTPYFLELGTPAPATELPALPTSAHYQPELVPALTRTPELARTPGIFDAHAVKRDFPILSERVNGRPLVWLDNAATTQKPRAVIERLSYFYEHENSNIHRAAHALAARATDAYEAARDKVRRFLNAPSPQEIIFVRGGTEAINLVAKSWGARNIGAGDEIVITHLEHHANIVPWQQLAQEKGARLKVAPVNDAGEVKLEEFERLLGPRTRIVSITHVSNALGTVVPVKTMTEIAHRYGARVLVDGAQAVSHTPVDVQAIDCDFYCFSGHKVFGPTGIGALYGKKDVLEAMPPWQGGGNMISDVTFERTVYQPPPFRFEAGTGNIADAVGLGAALDYVSAIGMSTIERYEHELLVYGTEKLCTVPGLTLVGTSPEKAGVLSFVLDGQRTEDVGGALDREGIAVRSGHHCAQPILRRFGYESTVRASLAFYNTPEDLDALVAALLRLQAGRPRRGL